MQKKSIEDIINLCKNQGFIYPSSEIYNGLANSYDFGPLGSQIKKKIKDLWWKEFVQKEINMHGLDSAIILNNNVWEASGHLGGFSDPLIDCKECKTRFRVDQLIESWVNDNNIQIDFAIEAMPHDEMKKYIEDNNIKCPNCGKLNYTDIREFNLMFKTHMGVLETENNIVHLRPETAQGIFINFKNIQRTTRAKLPFGVAQIGKSFRNEITPGNFIFRTREFEQMEIEYFVKPEESKQEFEKWENKIESFLNKLGLGANITKRVHEKDELAHYSDNTIDFEYNFCHGQAELWGLASRSDFDLKRHQEHSKKDLTYLDPQTNERYLPYVIEPSVGVERLMLAIITEAYEKEMVDDDEREVLKIHPAIAPYTCAVLPLTKKISNEAMEVYKMLSSDFNVEWDEAGTIGKRYRRQDAQGTPYAITFDFDSLEDGQVTVRDRDTMNQERIKIEDLKEYLNNKIIF